MLILRCFRWNQSRESGTDLPNPKGIESSSPGLRGTSYPGKSKTKAPQPQRGCGKDRGRRPQPRWGWNLRALRPQGSSFLATLGFEPESLWDSDTRLHWNQRRTAKETNNSFPSLSPVELALPPRPPRGTGPPG